VSTSADNLRHQKPKALRYYSKAGRGITPVFAYTAFRSVNGRSRRTGPSIMARTLFSSTARRLSESGSGTRGRL